MDKHIQHKQNKKIQHATIIHNTRQKETTRYNDNKHKQKETNINTHKQKETNRDNTRHT